MQVTGVKEKQRETALRHHKTKTTAIAVSSHSNSNSRGGFGGGYSGGFGGGSGISGGRNAILA